MIIRARIWLKRLKIIVGLLLPSWSVPVWSHHSAQLATGRGDFALKRKRSAHRTAPPALPRGQALAGADGACCLQSKCMSVSYVSVQGSILKQADSYFLLSVVVVMCGPYGEDTETCSSVSLNCHHNLIIEVATGS